MSVNNKWNQITQRKEQTCLETVLTGQSQVRSNWNKLIWRCVQVSELRIRGYSDTAVAEGVRGRMAREHRRESLINRSGDNITVWPNCFFFFLFSRWTFLIFSSSCTVHVKDELTSTSYYPPSANQPRPPGEILMTRSSDIFVGNTKMEMCLGLTQLRTWSYTCVRVTAISL